MAYPYDKMTLQEVSKGAGWGLPAGIQPELLRLVRNHKANKISSMDSMTHAWGAVGSGVSFRNAIS